MILMSYKICCSLWEESLSTKDVPDIKKVKEVALKLRKYASIWSILISWLGQEEEGKYQILKEDEGETKSEYPSIT